MAIKSTYKANIAYRELWANQEKEYLILTERMKIHCMEFLKDTREQPEGHNLGFYNNRTKELRKSIAAYIFRNGKIIWKNEDGNVAENRRLILDVPIPRRGFAAIGIAGKDYASKVEQYGYNVISAQGRTFVFKIEMDFINMRNTIKLN